MLYLYKFTNYNYLYTLSFITILLTKLLSISPTIKTRKLKLRLLKDSVVLQTGSDKCRA